MKKILLVCLTMMALSVGAQNVNIPDANFKKALIAQGVDKNGDGEIQVSEAEVVTEINVAFMSISCLKGIEYFTALENLDCYANDIDTIDLNKNVNIKNLECMSNNILSCLNIKNCLKLEYLDFSWTPKLKTIDMSNNIALSEIKCNHSRLITLDVSKQLNLTHLDCSVSKLTNIDISNNRLLIYLDCSGNRLKDLEISNNIGLRMLNYSSTGLNNVDVSNHLALTHLSCGSNNIKTLDVSKHLSLSYLDCSRNPLSSLDIRNLIALTYLDYSYTKINNLDIYNNTALTYFDCSYNTINKLDISNHLALTNLHCSGNSIDDLNIRSNTSLKELFSNSCTFKSIEISNNKALEVFICDSSQLTSLDISQNKNLRSISFCANKSLFEICINNAQLDSIINEKLSFRKDNFASWSTACSNTSNAGYVYNDINKNGIKDIGEQPLENIIVKEDTASYCFSTNNAGAYKAYYNTGSYSLNIPNPPKYCTVNPSSHSFDGLSDSLNNFGLQFHDALDVSVYLSSSNAARPGFNTYYYLTIKNNGTVAASGKVKLAADKRLNYVKSSPAQSSSIGDTIEWDYTNLLPKESREISATFLLPATVELGDTLFSAAVVTPKVGDSCVADNFFTDKKIVTGSYDPNSKEVSDTVMLPEEVANGKDLIYTVHFQNTGTDTAFNIVVKDTLSPMLNAAYIETLAASHSYSFKLLEGNVAAWTFSNILLPDSGRNQLASNGYFMFKIKAKNSLVIGDEIKNKADIYFDYNAPIVTNTAITKVDIKAGISERANNLDMISIYPNPASEKITIKNNSNKAGKYLLSLNTMQGQEVVSKEIMLADSYVLNLENVVEGVYFLMLRGEDGVRVEKVVVKR